MCERKLKRRQETMDYEDYGSQRDQAESLTQSLPTSAAYHDNQRLFCLFLSSLIYCHTYYDFHHTEYASSYGSPVYIAQEPLIICDQVE